MDFGFRKLKKKKKKKANINGPNNLFKFDEWNLFIRRDGIVLQYSWMRIEGKVILLRENDAALIGDMHFVLFLFIPFLANGPFTKLPVCQNLANC